MNFPYGLILEHRVQRLFLARGIFAERTLYPAVGDDYERIATDIDVLATEYGTGFYAKRLNVECKSGKVSKLDRIIWLAGIQRLLNADVSYFIVPDVETDVARFGKDLNVLTFSDAQLSSWENSLGLNADAWFARSNFHLFEPAYANWIEHQKQAKGADSDWLLFKSVNRFLKYDSWLNFSYADLNRLFRLANSIVICLPSLAVGSDKALCARYSLAALFVRFSQMLVDLCEEVLTVPTTQLPDYLKQRLIFGDSEYKNSGLLIEKTIDWIHQALRARGQSLPDEIDASRLMTQPSYTDEFVSLVHLLLGRSSETCYLPLTAELLMFSLIPQENWTATLSQSFAKGEHLTVNAKAFFLRALGLPASSLDNISADLRTQYQRTVSSSSTKTPNNEDAPVAVVSPAVLADMPLPVQTEGPKTEPTVSEETKNGTYLIEPHVPRVSEHHNEVFIEIEKLGDSSYYLKISNSNGDVVSDDVLNDAQLIKVLEILGMPPDTEQSKFQLNEKQTETIGDLKVADKKLSNLDKERIAATWIEDQLRNKAKTTGHVINNKIKWLRKGQQNEFIVKINGAKRIFEVSAIQLSEIGTNREARVAFSKRIDDELFNRYRRKEGAAK